MKFKLIEIIGEEKKGEKAIKKEEKKSSFQIVKMVT